VDLAQGGVALGPSIRCLPTYRRLRGQLFVMARKGTFPQKYAADLRHWTLHECGGFRRIVATLRSEFSSKAGRPPRDSRQPEVSGGKEIRGQRSRSSERLSRGTWREGQIDEIPD
jgi:hypothetical protein